MPKAADPQLTERIAKVALQLLDERGPKGVTIRAVAAAAGVATTTVYERSADFREAHIRSGTAVSPHPRQTPNQELACQH